MIGRRFFESFQSRNIYWFVRSFSITTATTEAYRSDFLKALLRNGVAPSAVDSEQEMSVIEDKEVRALVKQLGATVRTHQNVHGIFIEQTERLLAAVGAELGVKEKPSQFTGKLRRVD